MDSYHHIFDNVNASSVKASSVCAGPAKDKDNANANASADASINKPLPKNVQKSIALISWNTNGKALRHNDYTENFEFCEDEIKIAFSKKSWNALDKCFKWQYIGTYLESLALSDVDVATIKLLFVQNKLKEVVFNNKERIIKSLNIVIKSGDGTKSL